jgi:hypothetical protein
LKGELCKVEKEEFNMVSYSIIRHSQGNKNNLMTDRDDILLLQLNFNGLNNGISIIKYDIEKNGEESLKPLLNENYTIEYIKTLWIAEGSFCEED